MLYQFVVQSENYRDISTFFDKRAYDELQSSLVHKRALETVSNLYYSKFNTRTCRPLSVPILLVQLILHMMFVKVRSAKIDVIFRPKIESFKKSPRIG